MDKPAILVVDDREVNLYYLQELLKRYDTTIDCVTSGAECLDILAVKEFTLILMDVMMPDLNGIETARRIRELKILTPIIFITALAKDEKYILESYEIGGIDYIMKPIRSEILETKINTVLKLYDQKKKLEQQTQELTHLNQRMANEMAIHRDMDVTLQKSHQIFKTVMDSMDAIIMVIDIASNEILFTNKRAQECLQSDMTKNNCKETLINTRWSEYSNCLSDSPFSTSEKIQINEIQDTNKNKWYELREQIIQWIDGRSVLLKAATDISDRKKLEEKQKLAMAVFDNALEAIMVTDTQGIIQMINSAFSVITGYDSEEVIGKDMEILYSDRYAPEYYQLIHQELTIKGFWVGEIWNQRKNGDTYPEWLTLSAIKNQQDQITQYLYIFSDITIRKQFDELIKYKAYHDPLTGLPNRELLFDRLSMALAKAERNGNPLALIFLDLDNFKIINDQYGHHLGDDLLKEISRRLHSIVRKSDTIARYGGDEFIFLLTDLPEPSIIERVAVSIISAVESITIIKNQQISISCSLGISLYPDHGKLADELIQHADKAMYQVKKNSQPLKYCFYQPT